MLLLELFDDSASTDLKGQLKASIMDTLTPLVAQGVPYTTVDAIIDELQRESTTNLRIDRALVMQLCDPNEMKIVKKIEGDRLYFTLPEPEENEKTDADEEKDLKRVHQHATTQAKKNLKPGRKPALKRDQKKPKPKLREPM